MINTAGQVDQGKFNCDGTAAKLSDFPGLHPLVVHFPFVLLILAIILQFIELFVFRRGHGWVTLSLLFIGLLGVRATEIKNETNSFRNCFKTK
ncbi:MAG: hypothetical protein ACOCW8_01075 [bacterium]